MFDRMLVPLDGSSESESVLTWLRSWGLADSKVILYHCVPPASPKEDPQGGSRFETVEQAEEYLGSVGRAIPAATEIVVRTGNPGERIVTAALQAETGLVVLGLAGDYGTPRTLSKTAETVAKTCPKPVLVVKTPAKASCRRVRRILAPLHGAALGDGNMDVLRSLARELRAEVVLLHVSSPEPDGPVEPSAYSDVQLSLIRQVWGFLKEGIAARTIMTKGSIVEETLAHEQSLDVDIVAIPREGQAGLRSLTPILGQCERPVLLYEPQEVASAVVPATGRFAAVTAPTI